MMALLYEALLRASGTCEVEDGTTVHGCVQLRSFFSLHFAFIGRVASSPDQGAGLEASASSFQTFLIHTPQEAGRGSPQNAWPARISIRYAAASWPTALARAPELFPRLQRA